MASMLLIMGFIGVAGSIYSIRYTLKSKSFCPVEATVESSEIERNKTVTDRGSAAWHKVVFSYEVNGQIYHTSPHIYGRTDVKAEKQAERYPIGSKHVVLYNPKRPQQIIIPDNISVVGMIFLFFIGSGLIVAGIYLCFFD